MYYSKYCFRKGISKFYNNIQRRLLRLTVNKNLNQQLKIEQYQGAMHKVTDCETTFKANKYKSLCWLSTQRTTRNLLLITLPQKHDYVPGQASNEPTIHQPRDSSLWPDNNYPSRFWQSAMYQFQM